MTTAFPSWPSETLLTSPWYAALRPVLRRLGWRRFPSAEEWAVVPDAMRPRNVRGQILSFDAPELLGAENYERRILASGQVATRTANWHDAFNALCWHAWPRAKAALNALHVAELGRQAGMARSGVRDRATLFDESGIVLACADPGLHAALADHDWPTLFVQRADAWGRLIEPFIFGHAVLEKGLAPYIGVTARAWVIEVDAGWFALDEADKVAQLDQRIAAGIEAGALAQTGLLCPLPLLGIPAWWPLQDAAFYADETHFRRRRDAARRRPPVVHQG